MKIHLPQVLSSAISPMAGMEIEDEPKRRFNVQGDGTRLVEIINLFSFRRVYLAVWLSILFSVVGVCLWLLPISFGIAGACASASLLAEAACQNEWYLIYFAISAIFVLVIVVSPFRDRWSLAIWAWLSLGIVGFTILLEIEFVGVFFVLTAAKGILIPAIRTKYNYLNYSLDVQRLLAILFVSIAYAFTLYATLSQWLSLNALDAFAEADGTYQLAAQANPEIGFRFPAGSIFGGGSDESQDGNDHRPPYLIAQEQDLADLEAQWIEAAIAGLGLQNVVSDTGMEIVQHLQMRRVRVGELQWDHFLFRPDHDVEMLFNLLFLLGYVTPDNVICPEGVDDREGCVGNTDNVQAEDYFKEILRLALYGLDIAPNDTSSAGTQPSNDVSNFDFFDYGARGEDLYSEAELGLRESFFVFPPERADGIDFYFSLRQFADDSEKDDEFPCFQVAYRPPEAEPATGGTTATTGAADDSQDPAVDDPEEEPAFDHGRFVATDECSAPETEEDEAASQVMARALFSTIVDAAKNSQPVKSAMRMRAFLIGVEQLIMLSMTAFMLLAIFYRGVQRRCWARLSREWTHDSHTEEVERVLHALLNWDDKTSVSDDNSGSDGRDLVRSLGRADLAVLDLFAHSLDRDKWLTIKRQNNETRSVVYTEHSNLIRGRNRSSRWFLQTGARLLPAIGFIGTVRGIMEALGDADIIVRATTQSAQADAVTQIASVLGVSFTTTFVALVLGVALTMLGDYQSREEREEVDRLRDLLLGEWGDKIEPPKKTPEEEPA